MSANKKIVPRQPNLRSRNAQRRSEKRRTI